MLRRVLFVIFRCWAPCARNLDALWRLGRSVSALGSSLAPLGGHLAHNGSTRDPCHAVAGCDRRASNSILEPKALFREPRCRWSRAKCHRPWAFSETHTQQPKENLHFSWFGAARGHASESFFRNFSLLGALWSTSGRALATLGRSVSALGSSLAALGDHLAPKGSIRDP